MIRGADQDTAISESAKLIDQSKLAIFFTGAGISTPSGIPDFRGKYWILETGKSNGGGISVRFSESPNTFLCLVSQLCSNCLLMRNRMQLTMLYIIWRNKAGFTT